MQDEEFLSKYFSIVTQFLDILECGFARQHEPIKKIPLHNQNLSILNKTNLLSKSKFEINDHSHKNLKKNIQTSQNHPLHSTRKNVLIGEGVKNPVVMVIGETPEYYEDIQDLLFVGRNGQYLDKWLNSINLDRKKNCYIADIIKCRPNNREPNNDEMNQYLHYLQQQIRLLNPYIILACGRIAGQILSQRQSALASLRQEIHYYHEFPLIVTYHPSAVLCNQTLKRPVWEDLKLLKNQLIQIGITP